jgi:hypothetical protein
MLFISGVAIKFLYVFLFSFVNILHPPYPPGLDHSYRIWRKLKVMKLLVSVSLHRAVAFSVFYPYNFLSTILVSNTLSFRTSRSMKTNFTPITTPGRDYYLGCNRNINVSWLKSNRNSPILFCFQFLYACKIRFLMSRPNILHLTYFQNILYIFMF